MAENLAGLFYLTKSQVKSAAEVLAKAFWDYPMSVYFWPDEAKRTKRQLALCRRQVYTGIKYGEVYATSPQMEGVSVWFPSDRGQESFRERLTSGQFISQLFAGRETIARQRAFIAYATEIRKRVVPARHWYLQMLGVDPDYQGKGYASQLLRPMLARADKEGIPCYLETQLGKNVALYEHFGFRVAEQGIIPGSNVMSWAMVRGK